jgi:hypothetical protein
LYMFAAVITQLPRSPHHGHHRHRAMLLCHYRCAIA